MRQLAGIAIMIGVVLAPSPGWGWSLRAGVRSLRGYPLQAPGYVPYAGIPYVPYVAVPYAVPLYGPGVYQPTAPLVVDADRNWRDTWQDDGVKVHGYTLR
jgi:hypothetical protein